MNIEQFNELLNKGYAGALLLVIAVLLIAIYEKLRRSPHHRK